MVNVKTARLWTRIAKSLHRKRPGDNPISELPPVGQDPLTDRPPPLTAPKDNDAVADKQPGPLARWTQREQTLTKLQEGYEKMSGVVEDIRRHLVVQGERADRICDSMENLAQSLADHPAVSLRQCEMLETIARRLETNNERSLQVAERIGELPEISRAQNETLAGINRQLEKSGEQNAAVSSTIEKVGTALDSMGQAGTVQAEALRHMSVEATEQNEMLTRLIAAQSKRFTMLFVVTLVLAVAAVTTAIVSIAVQG